MLESASTEQNITEKASELRVTETGQCYSSALFYENLLSDVHENVRQQCSEFNDPNFLNFVDIIFGRLIGPAAARRMSQEIFYQLSEKELELYSEGKEEFDSSRVFTSLARIAIISHAELLHSTSEEFIASRSDQGESMQIIEAIADVLNQMLLELADAICIESKFYYDDLLEAANTQSGTMLH